MRSVSFDVAATLREAAVQRLLSVAVDARTRVSGQICGRSCALRASGSRTGIEGAADCTQRRGEQGLASYRLHAA